MHITMPKFILAQSRSVVSMTGTKIPTCVIIYAGNKLVLVQSAQFWFPGRASILSLASTAIFSVEQLLLPSVLDRVFVS